MASPAWPQDKLSMLQPEFASIISTLPPFPDLDFVSDKNLLVALRQQLSTVDDKVTIPESLEKKELKMPNGMMANVFQRRQQPSDHAAGAVLIVHGGGFVVGTPAVMTQTAIALCHDTGMTAIVLPYRLAPEAPFPAGIQDVHDGFRCVVENAASLAIDPTKLALYGQSAGADIAMLAYLAYVLSDPTLPRFKALVLSSPVFPQLSLQQEPTHARSVSWCWNTRSHKSALAAYRHGETNTQYPYMHTSQVDLKHLSLLPPTHIHIAEADFLAQEALQLSARLMQAGIELSVELRTGDVHIGLDVFITTETGKASRQKVVDHLGAHIEMQERAVMKEVLHPTDPIAKFPIDVDASTVTGIVKQYNSQTTNKRLQHVLDIAVSHLHDFVREANLSIDEWMKGILFLTRVGNMCSDIRQELILLSDVLGVSVLVDSLNNVKPKGATPSTVLGPFHTEDAPVLNSGDSMVSEDKMTEGTPMLVKGFVRDLSGNGVPNAKIETWETDATGHYDTQYAGRTQADCRGVFFTGPDGAYLFRCIVPVSYPIPSDGPVGQLLGQLNRHVFRPAHLHMMIEASGFSTLVTALYPRGDKFLQSDAVLGVKSDLVCDLETITGEDEAEKAGFKGVKEYVLLKWNFVLSS